MRTRNVCRSQTENSLWPIPLLSSHKPKLLLCLPTSPSFPPSFPHPSFHSSVPPWYHIAPVLFFLSLSPLLSFSGVLLWSTWTAGEPLTTVCVCVQCGWAVAVVCPRSSLSFSLTFAVFLLFLPLSKHTSSLPHPALTSSSSSSSCTLTRYHFLCHTICVLWLRSRCSWTRRVCNLKSCVAAAGLEIWIKLEVKENPWRWKVISTDFITSTNAVSFSVKQTVEVLNLRNFNEVWFDHMLTLPCYISNNTELDASSPCWKQQMEKQKLN